MTLSATTCTRHIAHYSQVLADAARDNLDARVTHCPDWTVADLVWHVTEVHWFWRTIADERLAGPVPSERCPDRPSDDTLVATFEQGAAKLVDVLGNADQGAACWTWARREQHVGFITRHQVQETAVHAWDAVEAAGGTLTLDPEAAADAVDEFLAVSLADESDAAEEDLTPLDATFVLRATDTHDAWTVTDGTVPGSLAMTRGATDGAPALEATASDLLLWLYGRAELSGAVPRDVVARFRGLTATD